MIYSKVGDVFHGRHGITFGEKNSFSNHYSRSIIYRFIVTFYSYLKLKFLPWIIHSYVIKDFIGIAKIN